MAESQDVSKQAIKKLEDQLTCAVCLDTYKEPKLLHCFHAYCKDCLQRLAVQTGSIQPDVGAAIEAAQARLSIRCPTCRKITVLSPSEGVNDLHPASHIYHLFEIQASLAKSNSFQYLECGKCKRTTRPAIRFCRHCDQFICELCVDIHGEWKEFATHEVIRIEDVHTSSGQDMVSPKEKVLYCPHHEGKELDIYCDTCEELICLHCTIKKHKDHEYDLVSDSFERHKAEITASLEPLDEQVTAARKVVEQLNHQSEGLDQQRIEAEAMIEHEIKQLHDIIEARKNELLKQVDDEIQRKLRNLDSQRDELQTAHDQLSNCLSVVNMSLAMGSDEEIVMMKDDMIKNIKQVTEPTTKRPWSPCEKANLKFAVSSELEAAILNFGQVSLDEVASRDCYAEGSGLKVAEVGETATVVVYVITKEGKACTSFISSLTCRLSSEITGETINGSVRNSEVNRYVISYQPTNRGLHQLHIKLAGGHIKGSPFNITVKLPVQKLGIPIKTIPSISRPWGVAINSRGELIVAEYRGRCISVFSSTGEKLRSFSSCGQGRDQLHSPRGVAVDSDDNILVVDGDHCIIKFTSDGEFVKAECREGNRQLEFKRPMGVGVHPHTGQLYVADTDNNRIQVLNSDLSFVTTFKGRRDKRLKSPWGVAFDNTGNVYIADCGNHCVQVFTVEGEFMRRFGGEGERNGELNFPSYIFIDSDDVAYVTEYGNHRVSVFTCDGQFLTEFGALGNGSEQFNEPRGITMDRNGYVIVSDCENDRIKLF